MATIPQEIQDLYDKIIKTPLKRKELFNQVAQEYFITLKGRPLEIAVSDMWLYFCQQHKDWVGLFFIPPEYVRNGVLIHPCNIFYTVKEFFMWAVLYPEEVDNFFTMNKDGSINIIGDQKIRLVTKENKRVESRDELGKVSYKEIKPELTFILPSGLTIAQKNSIVNTTMVGLLAEVKPYKEEVEAPPKKTRAKKVVKEIDTVEQTQEEVKVEKEVKAKKVTKVVKPKAKKNDTA